MADGAARDRRGAARRRQSRPRLRGTAGALDARLGHARLVAGLLEEPFGLGGDALRALGVAEVAQRPAFEQQSAGPQQSGALRHETEGKNAGCWVLTMAGDAEADADRIDEDKIIVRSNGTVTYTGKDIAYQLWKLGQVDLNFYFKPFRAEPDGRTVWTTTSKAEEAASEAPHFGAGATVYNVIDSRQAYPQEVVKRGVAAVAPAVGEAASVHLSYEMVALSPAAAEELGLELSAEEKARPFVEMSGRRGLGVKADDFIDMLYKDLKR